jgi:hypothetical protein
MTERLVTDSDVARIFANIDRYSFVPADDGQALLATRSAPISHRERKTDIAVG